MEFVPLGTLRNRIKNCERTGEMPWGIRHKLLCDVFEGMEFLHSPFFSDGSEKMELFHQDLKSANVLLKKDQGVLRAVITDFGLSSKSQPDKSYFSQFYVKQGNREKMPCDFREEQRATLLQSYLTSKDAKEDFQRSVTFSLVE